MARASDPILAQQAATHIVRTLRDAGHEAYFAGGCVRDALLGARPTDFDVATDATPPRVRSLFHAAQEIGESFGVVLVVVRAGDLGPSGTDWARDARACVEVATFRSDGPYHDARRPDHVTFSDALSDAQRRDFTINALFLDPLDTQPSDTSVSLRSLGIDGPGRVIDHVGGLADLSRKVIRAVGDPDRRLAEDHLRALRAVRFSARLAFAIDPDTARAIARHASQLRGVSRERIGEELRRVLAHPSAARALQTLHDLTLDAPVLDEPHLDAPPGGLRLATCLCQLSAHRPISPIGTLAAWLTDRFRLTHPQPWLAPEHVRVQVPRVRAALCLSNDESELLRDTLLCLHALQIWTALPIAKQKRLASRPEFSHARAIRTADDQAVGDELGRKVRELECDGIGTCPPHLVTGDDLVAAGFKPGPNFRVILDAVFDAQLEGRVRDREEAMELARRLSV